MKLRSLTTQNFRNLIAAETAFHPTTNLLIGRNGQGKTNVLEAIYFLATTKSFRTSRIASVFRFHEANVFVSGALERQDLEKTLSVGLGASSSAVDRWPLAEEGRGSTANGERRTANGPRRVLMINGEKVTLPAYLHAMSVFAYSSARLDILRGAPEERRRFLDRGIASLNPAYLEQLTRYGRVLKQRNALLHDVATKRETPASLDAWDDELRTAAAVVHRARDAYAADLAVAFRDIVARHGYHVANVELLYRPSLVDAFDRRAELRARMSLVGPQRDNIDFVIDGRPAAEVLSGGEQKMIVLFLKFAKLELFRRRQDEPPLFLLDDIDAELDLEILQALLTKLPASTQLFATSAKEVVLHALEAGPHRRLSIENGRVTATRDFG
ncbi:MAG TPA: DNA replication and repair protein RecF [Thermoanaerobaculia bacterium]|nr:DNA replication and repair protein RecF [Thermoanaerobaculia bacterium]